MTVCGPIPNRPRCADGSPRTVSRIECVAAGVGYMSCLSLVVVDWFDSIGCGDRAIEVPAEVYLRRVPQDGPDYVELPDRVTSSVE